MRPKGADVSDLFSIETFRSSGVGPHDMGQWVDRSDKENPKMLRRETGERRVEALRAQGEAINAAVAARERAAAAKALREAANMACWPDEWPSRLRARADAVERGEA